MSDRPPERNARDDRSATPVAAAGLFAAARVPRKTRLRDPGEIAALIARNITPVAALLFFNASAPNLVALYSLDTLLYLYMFSWLVIVHVTEAKADWSKVSTPLKFGLAAIIVGTLLGAFLIGPMLVVLSSYHWFDTEAWKDPAFHGALAAQAVGTGYSILRLHRFLQQTDDDDHILGEQFKLLVARWVVVLGVVFFGAATFLGPRFGSILIILVYSGASIYFEMFPEKAHQMFHGKDPPADGKKSRKDRKKDRPLPLP